MAPKWQTFEAEGAQLDGGGTSNCMLEGAAATKFSGAHRGGQIGISLTEKSNFKAGQIGQMGLWPLASWLVVGGPSNFLWTRYRSPNKMRTSGGKQPGAC